MPGCLSFLLFTGQNQLIQIHQLVTDGPYSIETFPLTNLSKNFLIVGAAIDFWDEIGWLCIFGAEGVLICEIFDGTKILNTQDQRMRYVRWNQQFRPLANIPKSSSELLIYGIETKNKTLSLKTVNIHSETIMENHIEVNEAIVDAATTKSRDLIIITTKSVFLLRNDTLTLKLFHGDNFTLLDFGCMIQTEKHLTAACMNADETLIISGDRGSNLFGYNIGMNNLGDIGNKLVMTINEGKAYKNLLRNLHVDDKGTQGLFISNILVNLSSSMRKAHYHALLTGLLLRFELMNDYAWFCSIYYRLNHFWEVAISCTIDLGKTLGIIEQLDEKANFEFQFETIMSIHGLTVETTKHLVAFFSANGSRRNILKKAMQIASVHYRIISIIILIKAIRHSLVILMDKYKNKHLFTLMNYFGDFMTDLDAAFKHMNFDEVIRHSKTYPTQPVGFEFLFNSTTVTDPPLYHIGSEDPDEEHVVLTNDRDPISGKPIDYSSFPLLLFSRICRRCGAYFVDKSLHGQDYPFIPFWHFHYQFCCPCGYSR